MLDYHGISLEAVTAQALAALPIKQGAVDGVFSYTPPPPPIKAPPAPSSDAGPKTNGELTIDDVKRMSVDDINKNWEQVAESARFQSCPPAAR